MKNKSRNLIILLFGELREYFHIVFLVEIKNVSSSIDAEDMKLIFTDPKKYGYGIKIKDVHESEAKEGFRRFIIEFEREEGL